MARGREWGEASGLTSAPFVRDHADPPSSAQPPLGLPPALFHCSSLAPRPPSL